MLCPIQRGARKSPVKGRGQSALAGTSISAAAQDSEGGNDPGPVNLLLVLGEASSSLQATEGWLDSTLPVFFI